MTHDLSLLIRRKPPTQPAFAGRATSAAPGAIIDPAIARRLGQPYRPAPLIDPQDLRDALMAFALVFTGAMVFLM